MHPPENTRNRFSSAEINVGLLSLWWLWRVSLLLPPDVPTTTPPLLLRNPHHLVSEAENGETAYVSVSTYKKVEKSQLISGFALVSESLKKYLKVKSNRGWQRCTTLSFSVTLVWNKSLTKFFRAWWTMNEWTVPNLCDREESLLHQTWLTSCLKSVLKLS